MAHTTPNQSLGSYCYWIIMTRTIKYIYCQVNIGRNNAQIIILLHVKNTHFVLLFHLIVWQRSWKPEVMYLWKTLYAPVQIRIVFRVNTPSHTADGFHLTRNVFKLFGLHRHGTIFTRRDKKNAISCHIAPWCLSYFGWYVWKTKRCSTS